jgi:anaphase-promoting complex subunit 8
LKTTHDGTTDWDLAEHLFDYIFLEDPCRIDGMDIYSNILYVAEKRAKLSKLSRCLLELDKDRPEVCCVVGKSQHIILTVFSLVPSGNYYSLRGDHERAIKYFRKALHLDRTYIPACTLMGHEHIELKRSEEAIESYRSGIDLNRMDYRAWFGLGQAYELLSMHNYALHYYQRAIALR